MNKVYDNSWENLNTAIAYGFGQVGKRYIELFQKHFSVKYIVDNNSEIDSWRGIPVISVQEMIALRNDEKIVIFASRTAYQSIKKSLEQYELKEPRDFCKFDDFITNWYWQFENKNVLREVHTSINTNCTFKCKNCNMFMPHYKCHYQYALEDLKRDFELFFSKIDYVYVFSLLGGEPFLNKELGVIIEEINKCYSSKIGRIEIITNGSLLPDAEVVKTLRKCNVTLRISDYTIQIPYKKRLEELCELLESNEIEYSVESSLKWTDFMFPDKECEKIADVRRHMLCCSPEFHGLNDGKFYYCHVAWSAEKAGLIELKDTDCIDLASIDVNDKNACRRIVDHADGKIDSGYVSLCEFCMGCGDDNKNFIPVGEQCEK